MSGQSGSRHESEDKSVARQASSVPSRVSRRVTVASSWRGPVPRPQTLRRFEEVVPGAAERILSMAEEQAAHRIDIERTSVVGDSNRSYLGLAAGFILSVTIVLGGFYVMINVHPWAGASVIGTQIAVIAGVFVYGTSSRRDERDRKSERTRPLMVHDVPDDDQPQPLDSEEQDQANRD